MTLDLGAPVPRREVAVYEYSGVDRFALGQWPARTVEGRTLTLDLPAMAVLRCDLRQ